jgi:hypothetical protein
MISSGSMMSCSFQRSLLINYGKVFFRHLDIISLLLIDMFVICVAIQGKSRAQSTATAVIAANPFKRSKFAKSFESYRKNRANAEKNLASQFCKEDNFNNLIMFKNDCSWLLIYYFLIIFTDEIKNRVKGFLEKPETLNSNDLNNYTYLSKLDEDFEIVINILKV